MAPLRIWFLWICAASIPACVPASAPSPSERAAAANDGPAKTSGPRAKFSEMTFAGSAVDGHLRHTFRLKNVGDADLQILKITSSCSCLTPHVDGQSVAPGAELPIEVDMTARTDRQEAFIFLQMDDPITPYVELKMRVEGGLPDIFAFLPFALQVRVRAGETVRGKCALRLESMRRDISVETFDKVEITTTDPQFTVRLAATQSDDPSFILWSDPANRPAPKVVSGRTLVDLAPVKSLLLQPVEFEYRAGDTKGTKFVHAQAKLRGDEATAPGILIVRVDVE